MVLHLVSLLDDWMGLLHKKTHGETF